MRSFHFFGLLLVLLGSLPLAGQTLPATGSVRLIGQFNNAGKVEKLTRKRFYLLHGGLQENKGLLERIQAAEIISRDCYYSKVQASPQFICWLQTENCESPFCRKIETADIDRVPEFKAAYQKGLTLFGRKPKIAQDWLITNLPPIFTDGYYHEKETLLKKLLADVKPVQSSMTPTVGVDTTFVDIPLTVPEGKKGETYTISNILPIELGGKSFVWSCQIEVPPDKKVTLRLPDTAKPVNACKVVVKDLAACKAGDCGQK